MPVTDNDKDIKGRSLEQVTDGSTSAATMGSGATGDVGASAERKDLAQRAAEGARQQGDSRAGRTDDLLAGGSDAEQGDQGFREAPQSRQGSQSAAGNRQSGEPGRQQADEGGIDRNAADEGSARR